MKKEIIRQFVWRNRTYTICEHYLKYEISLLPTCGDAYQVIERRQLKTDSNVSFWATDSKILFWGSEEKAKKFFNECKSVLHVNGKLQDEFKFIVNENI